MEADQARPPEAEIIRTELGFLDEELRQVQDDLTRLYLQAPASGGRFLAHSNDVLPGRRLSRGQEIGWIVRPDDRALLRMAVPAGRIDLFATPPRDVRVHLPGQPFGAAQGRLMAIAPEATRNLDFPSLSAAAGGPLQMDPTDDRGRRTTQPFHVAEVATDLPLSDLAVGGLVWARFDHGPTPLAPRLWRAVRQTFLTRLAL